MAIGQAVTKNFPIGSAEIRVGPLEEANRLQQSHSMGLLSSANINFTQDSVGLSAGLPNTLIDSAITNINVKVSAQIYEYSRKNISLALNEGSSNSNSVSGSVVQAVTAENTGTTIIETNIPVGNLSVGDMLIIFPDKLPENFSSVQITNVENSVISGNEANAKVTIDNTKTSLLFNYSVDDPVFRANQIGLGQSTKTNYFTLDVIGLDRITGKPTGFKFWKVAVEGGLEYSYSNDSFAVTPMTFKVLQPSSEDLLPGKPLHHIADLVTKHPYGMQFSGEGNTVEGNPSVGYEFLYDVSGNILSDSSSFIEVLVA